MNNSKLLLSKQDEIQKISAIIDCPKEIVEHCMRQIGSSIPAIDAYWQMNRDRLVREIETAEK